MLDPYELLDELRSLVEPAPRRREGAEYLDDAPSRPDIAVEDADPADAEVLAGLLRQLGRGVTACGLERFITGLELAHDRVLVARAGGRPVGVAHLHGTPFPHAELSIARLTALVIDERWRSRGVGRELLRGAEAAARQMGCAALDLTSGQDNVEARRFYQREGYEPRSLRFRKEL